MAHRHFYSKYGDFFYYYMLKINFAYYFLKMFDRKKRYNPKCIYGSYTICRLLVYTPLNFNVCAKQNVPAKQVRVFIRKIYMDKATLGFLFLEIIVKHNP